jgi:branched-chain amino acid transport system substrate-binding protein
VDGGSQEYVRNYRELFPDGLESPSLLAYGYYVNSLAALLALKQIDCDLSDDQAAFKNALSNLAFDTPTGPVRLDHNRNAIAHIFIREVSERADGRHYNKLVKTIPEVNQTLGMPEDEYLQMGALTRDNPSCP